jgi:uncharacterized membrane protein YjgN (DUF898 family)
MTTESFGGPPGVEFPGDALTDRSAASMASAAAVPELKLAYRGEGLDLFLVVLKNLFLTLITLGIYTPWATTARRGYLWKQMAIEGQPLDWTGTGSELFVGYLKLAAAYLVFFGVPKIVGMVSPMGGAALQIIGGLAVVILLPHAIYWSRRYLLGRTRWRGIRFGLAGEAGGFAKIWLKGFFLTIVTLGFYAPIFANRVYGALVRNMRYGTAAFSYDGSDREAFRIGIKGFFLSVITLGIYWFWYSASVQRFRMAHIGFDRAMGSFQITGGLLLKLTLINFFGTLFTLGIAFPWIVTYTLRTMLARITFIGHVDFTVITQQVRSGDAAGDALGDVLGVELGV